MKLLLNNQKQELMFVTVNHTCEIVCLEVSEWVIVVSRPTQQFFSYIMVRTS